MCVFCTCGTFFLLRPLVLPRVLGSGARREPAYTRRHKCGRWSRSVARALGVQSRENLQVTTGSVFDDLEPRRCHATAVQLIFICMNYDDLFLQRRIRRTLSTQHARDNKNYSTPT